jgi:hypothetical protein
MMKEMDRHVVGWWGGGAVVGGPFFVPYAYYCRRTRLVRWCYMHVLLVNDPVRRW